MREKEKWRIVKKSFPPPPKKGRFKNSKNGHLYERKILTA